MKILAVLCLFCVILFSKNAHGQSQYIAQINSDSIAYGSSAGVEGSTDVYITDGVSYFIDDEPAYLIWKGKDLFVRNNGQWLRLHKGGYVIYKTINVITEPQVRVIATFDTDQGVLVSQWR